MKNLTRLSVLSCIFFLFIAGCKDECREYSDFSCEDIQTATYNIYFYYPDGSEVYLGIVNGLNECGNISSNFASSKNLLENNDWSYVCCMKAKGSDCYEKHR
jgi:hypothetical protein